jgi:hypothetical protein
VRQPLATSLAVLEDLVLSAIEEDVLAPDVVSAAVARAAEIIQAQRQQSPTGDDPRATRAELADVQERINNLTAVAAAGASDVASLVNALRALETRRRALVAATSDR